jgi:DNA polymerase III gamma/tau subunit
MAKQMADAIAAADRELAPMQQAVNNANNKLSQAKGAAEKNAGDANLKKAVEAAQKEADEAAAKMKAAQDKKSAAEKASQEAQTSAKAAGEAKSAAEKAAQEAMQKSQRLEQVKQQVAQRAQEIANQSKPRNINVGLVSTPIVLRITPAPITVQFAASPGEIEQGGKLEVPVMINRMYGFNGQVDLQIAGGSPAGIKVSNLSIPANQNQGKLVLEANKDAAAGERKLNVEARMNFNGQINVRQEVVIRVVPKK